ncbi:MAG: hypothetical protein EOM73_08605 [Bacteroidia bacterium]|nr:hypothetical protein [Bacteroidia bacterium]
MWRLPVSPQPNREFSFPRPGVAAFVPTGKNISISKQADPGARKKPGCIGLIALQPGYFSTVIRFYSC